MNFEIAKTEDTQSEDGFYITLNKSGNKYSVVATNKNGHQSKIFNDKETAENIYMYIVKAIIQGNYSERNRLMELAV